MYDIHFKCDGGFISIWVALVIHLIVKPQRGGGNSQALFALGEYSAAGVEAEFCGRDIETEQRHMFAVALESKVFERVLPFICWLQQELFVSLSVSWSKAV